jgi:hypothetical protein
VKNKSDNSNRLPEDPSDSSVEELAGRETIEAAEFTPLSGKAGGRSFKPSRTVLAAALGLLACVPIIYFLFSARSIEIETTPAAEQLNIDGGVVLPVGNRFLLLPGAYTLEAQASGYYPLREAFEVTDESSQEFVFQLDLLPDLLSIRSTPVDRADVNIDGEPAGQTPLNGIELAAGRHTVELAAPRYQVHSETLDVAGGGNPLELTAVLLPAWSEVTIDSTPGGAAISVDGEEVGLTPATLELLLGRRDISLKLPGYKSWQSGLDVPANEAITVPTVELQVADGRLVVNTRPGNANVLIDGQFAGRSSLEINLEPGKSYRIEAYKAGYRNAGKAVTIASGQEQTVTLNLQADLGEVTIRKNTVTRGASEHHHQQAGLCRLANHGDAQARFYPAIRCPAEDRRTGEMGSGQATIGDIGGPDPEVDSPGALHHGRFAQGGGTPRQRTAAGSGAHPPLLPGDPGSDQRTVPAVQA